MHIQAYHFLVLAQRQFYREKYEQALVTALHLKEYDDILDRDTVYQLIGMPYMHFNTQAIQLDQ